jgi:hypothetical protein
MDFLFRRKGKCGIQCISEFRVPAIRATGRLNELIPSRDPTQVPFITSILFLRVIFFSTVS